jgi:uncharacterized protein YyaL (SSP411 family)
MTRIARGLLCALCVLLSGCQRAAPGSQSVAGARQASTTSAAPPRWQPWARASFDRAAREQKLLLVSVQTQWCHWCHVMNDVTFRDPEVAELLAQHFVVIRVDADARPDLAERYLRWGWPATGLLTSQAVPLVNFKGYQEPRGFARALSRAVRGEGFGSESLGATRDEHSLRAGAHDPADSDWVELHRKLLAQLDQSWDEAQAGWGTPQKYPRAAPVEHGFYSAAVSGESTRTERSLRALSAYRQLIDPVWGGMFQYSVHGDWLHPHYEKIHAVQAGALENFSHAYLADGDARHLDDARAIVGYLTERLRRPDGGFYANQDADVGRPGEPDHQRGKDFYALRAPERATRRAPGIDANVYADLNGMSSAALARLYESTLDPRYLELAEAAVRVIERGHRRGDGYAHSESGQARVLYLSDQLEMARALLALHEVTGSAAYAERLAALVHFIVVTFEDATNGGFYAHSPDPDAVGVFAETRKPLGANARLARVLLRIARRDARPELRDKAERALRAVGAAATFVAERRQLPEYLLTLEELLGPYTVITLVGEPDDPRTLALQRAALEAYAPNRRLVSSAPARSHYPYPGEPVAYLCSDNSCSLPLHDPRAIAGAVRASLRPVKPR